MPKQGARQEPVDVVVLAARREATLERCLEGLIQQEAPVDFLITVVDAVPSLGAADAALRHPAVHGLALTSRGGVGALCQRAVDAAQFERVALLDASYWPGPAWLADRLSRLESGAEIVIGCAEESGSAGSGFTDMVFRRYVADRIRLEPALAGDSEDVGEWVRRCKSTGFCVVHAQPAGKLLPSTVARSSELEGSEKPLPSPGFAPQSVLRPGPPRSGDDSYLISVLVCTAGRRPVQLERCISSLAKLEDSNFEVLLVENARSPQLAAVQLPARMRHIHEPIRGLDHARNRGLRESSGEVVAYIDDDCVAHPGWLRGLRKAFDDPSVSFVGGRVRPVRLDRESDQWFEYRFPFDRGPSFRRFTAYDHGGWSPLLMGAIGTGANMAFRRSLLERVGGFDVNLDMGTLVGGGGDLDIFARALQTGEVCEYAADAVIFHDHRETHRKLRWQTWGYGVSQGAMCAKYLLRRGSPRIHPVIRYLRLLRDQSARLAACREGRDRYPEDLALLELVGTAIGPLAYVVSAVHQRRHSLR